MKATESKIEIIYDLKDEIKALFIVLLSHSISKPKVNICKIFRIPKTINSVALLTLRATVNTSVI